ncbi:MAG: hypothetical protein R3E01_09285 [Pirellulaceae bacterium]|nr:hypothetical protein [Planctomycetales bacterium]
MDDQTRQSLLIAFIAFNITVFIFQIAFNGMLGGTFTWGRFMIGVLVAAVVGGITFGVTKALNR